MTRLQVIDMANGFSYLGEKVNSDQYNEGSLVLTNALTIKTDKLLDREKRYDSKKAKEIYAKSSKFYENRVRIFGIERIVHEIDLK